MDDYEKCREGDLKYKISGYATNNPHYVYGKNKTDAKKRYYTYYKKQHERMKYSGVPHYPIKMKDFFLLLVE